MYHDSLMRSGKRFKVALQTTAPIENVENGALQRNKGIMMKRGKQPYIM